MGVRFQYIYIYKMYFIVIIAVPPGERSETMRTLILHVVIGFSELIMTIWVLGAISY